MSDKSIRLQLVTDILSRVRYAVVDSAPNAYMFGTSSQRRGKAGVVLDVFRDTVEMDCLERFRDFGESLGFVSIFDLCFDRRAKADCLVRFP
jgi:hypothetical protein